MSTSYRGMRAVLEYAAACNRCATTTGTSTDHGRAEAERVGGANPATSATQTVIKVSARLLAVAKPERSGEEAATEAVRKKAHHRVTLGIPGTPQTYVVTTNAQMPDS
ncbi:hypothetical protein PC129_g14154 [Phytophthora cactorum]|uniref:Uncharacterized protein n=1 Tax=Phytophthora cactorum TaxID=29920 RepID=A0A8T1HSE9_9STRA|nr:hypothetical protein PC112_g15682 [Phytophthora cactorum]KAG2812181.1 hypothetical protein PC111_g14909 [Phytophthora cactorum]KAG2887928.1 hypothetical protein PC114_g18614 [Phytophthora cactorum]KAG2903592.1 hypothetical protein PC115_g15257 [Phytophthora cactorum]KAG2919556.1 hypothetical protein PC117_g16735 [Phytophthora cactorum]